MKSFGMIQVGKNWLVYNRTTYKTLKESHKYYLATNIKEIMEKHIKKINGEKNG